MKTSKIIFITLLSSIAVLILSATLDVRLNGVKRDVFNHRQNFDSKKQTIAPFKVLCLNNSRNIILIQRDSACIILDTHKDSIAPQINYTIKDDTLWLTGFDKKNQNKAWLTVYCTNTLEDIQLINSGIHIKHFVSRKLSLNLDNSYLWMSQEKYAWMSQDEYKNHSMPILNIVAKNHSVFESGNFNVDSLGIVLQRSKADIQLIAGKISGTLSDSSRIEIPQPMEISLKKDRSSRMSINNY